MSFCPTFKEEGRSGDFEEVRRRASVLSSFNWSLDNKVKATPLPIKPHIMKVQNMNTSLLFTKTECIFHVSTLWHNQTYVPSYTKNNSSVQQKRHEHACRMWSTCCSIRGTTQKSCHKCCQLVLTNMVMVNTYTKIKL